MRARFTIFCAALALLGCDPEPRYGEAELSSAAPRATFTGTTFGSAAAMELAPGCPGYLDVETPGHVLRVDEDIEFDITARSDAAPLALAVAHGDEVRCDSDEGSGHLPQLTLSGAGDYQVYVAALREPAELAYEITARTGDARSEPLIAGAGPGAERTVNVTITSQPPGAQVRDEGGEVMGTTPAMFVVGAAAGETPTRRWTLSLPDHQEVTVSGELGDSALVLHAHLPSTGPVAIDVTADERQPIRDYQSAALAVDVGEDCAITQGEVEVDIQHSFIGDLRVVLRPPWEEDIVLHRHTGGGRRNLRRTWSTDDRPLSELVGRSTQGRWTLVVHDDAGADQGSFDEFSLRLTCGSAQLAQADPQPRRRPQTNRQTTVRTQPRPRPRQPRLRDLPTRSDIVRVLGALRPRVEQCGDGSGGSARVMATVSGNTGRVTNVTSSGISDATIRNCVHRVVRTARFGRFRRGSLDVDYTYALR